MPAARRRALSHAVAGLHRTFHRYPYRPAMPACPHCVSDADLRRLGRPLDELAVDEVRRYARKAITTRGDARDFKRMLPRLAELMITDSLAVDPQLVTGKLRRAAWQHWPEPEQAAVHHFLRAWWAEGLAEPPSSGCCAYRRLAAVAVADTDISPYLDDWQRALAADGPVRLAAVLHLVKLVIDHGGLVDDAGWTEALFDEPAAGAALAAWLTGSTTVIQLERAAYDYAGSPHGQRVAAATAVLEDQRPPAWLGAPIESADAPDAGALDQLPAPPGQKLRR